MLAYARNPLRSDWEEQSGQFRIARRKAQLPEDLVLYCARHAGCTSLTAYTESWVGRAQKVR
jgi:hypothetical protein